MPNLDSRRVTNAILESDEDFVTLYQTSAEFRAGVAYLTRHMLPLFLDGLARSSRALSGERDSLIREMARGKPSREALEELQELAREMGVDFDFKGK